MLYDRLGALLAAGQAAISASRIVMRAAYWQFVGGTGRQLAKNRVEACLGDMPGPGGLAGGSAPGAASLRQVLLPATDSPAAGAGRTSWKIRYRPSASNMTRHACSMNRVTVPPYQDLMWPTLLAVRKLGGSGSIEEIVEEVPSQLSLSEEQQAVLHGDGPATEIEYRLAWARTYLKGMGLLITAAVGVVADRPRPDRDTG